MTHNQLLAITKELVAIESTSHNPEGLRQAKDFMVSFLHKSGKDITIEFFERAGKPSLLAYRGPIRPERFHIILNGHLDVVPGKSQQYQAVIKDGKLYGRGVYDMKAACVILADLFCEFVDQIPFALGLQLTTDEESSGKHGTLYQIEQGVRSDFVICGECGRSTTEYEIANQAKGIVLAEIMFQGSSAHGAYPWKGSNAAIHAHNFVRALHEHFPIPTEATTESTVTITGMSATSGAHTKLPDEAMIKLDARYVPNDPDLSDMAKFTAFIKKLDPNAKIGAIHDFSSPLYTNPNNPLLLSLKTAAEEIEEATFHFVQRNATSDGRFYGAVGDQACEFGIAGEHQHGNGEFITIKAFKNYRATMHAFLQDAAKTHQISNNALPQRQTALRN